MRVLVLSNCSYVAYTGYLTAMFPDWDVRGVFLPQAAAWVAAGRTAFLDFVAGLDLFVGMTAQEPVASLVPDAVPRVHLPTFVHQGYQPDTVWLHGVPSPTGSGVIHSPIAASAWLAGRSAADAARLFEAAHLEALGYFDRLASERARVVALFGGAGLDIAAPFEDWARDGNFLHTPNHPRPPVFFDIVHAGMVRAGFGDRIDPELLSRARATLVDDLATGIAWPLYRGIAERHGLEPVPALWRTSDAAGKGVGFDLAGMLARTWAILDAHAQHRDAMTALLGGPEGVARYARA